MGLRSGEGIGRTHPSGKGHCFRYHSRRSGRSASPYLPESEDRSGRTCPLPSRALGEPIPPTSVERYLEGKFGADLERVKKAMQKLAKSYKPKEIANVAYPLYEQFRPQVPAGVKGWGAAGELDLHLIESMAKWPVSRA